ncbi:MAG: four-carbon acid sugar kinase family protein [Opitutales bacterium]
MPLKADLFASLPPAIDPTPGLPERIASSLRRAPLVILDDDPTGTQTVWDIPVLTTWSQEALRDEWEQNPRGFFILTNSRAVLAREAEATNREIARNLKAAAAGRPFHLFSRSDSTLRGHYPLETDVLAEELGPFDGVILCPYFEAGGRYTVGDVHYVQDEDRLVPAGETPFAQDASFGFRSSNLKAWVAEKTNGRIGSEAVASLSIEDMRKGGVARVRDRLLALQSEAPLVLNAADPRDLAVFVDGLMAAESAGKRFLFRTAAELVAARLGLGKPGHWRPPSSEASANVRGRGCLILIGSHVPKSTRQLDTLRSSRNVCAIELSVDAVLADADTAVASVAAEMNAALEAGRDTVVFTSRDLCCGASADASLRISARVSAALVAVLHHLSAAPACLIAKGGITASDLATKGLGIRRARVLGPLLPGVPVWEAGPETRYPGLPYVVFPGNVGDDAGLVAALDVFRAGS